MSDEMNKGKRFSPLIFQGSLAAGGVALMPFVLMQFSLPHGKGLIRLSDIHFGSMHSMNVAFLFSLIVTMAGFALVHFILTFFFLKRLYVWMRTPANLPGFLHTPLTNVGLMSPVISLAMSINVLFGPVFFFWPPDTNPSQFSMIPVFGFWFLLWAVLMILQAEMIKVWFTQTMDLQKLNFGWLLDSFAFGMVALSGAGIASLSSDSRIASLSAIMTWGVFIIGFFLFIVKWIYLLLNQIKSASRPDNPSLLTFLIVIPIVCLYGVSFYKLNIYLKSAFGFRLDAFSYLGIVICFVATGAYLAFGLYWLKSYFMGDFFKPHFYASQWGIVCAFVGFEVLAAHVYGNYYKEPWLILIIGASILLATIVYIMVLFRFLRAERAVPGSL